VSLDDRAHRVGQRHQGQTGHVRLDLQDKQWLFEDEAAGVLQRREATELTAEAIRTLSVSRGRKDKGGQTW
jgi:hypothetical protein